MKTFARIENGRIAELMAPMMDASGQEIPLAARFHPDIVATLIDVTGVTGVAEGWIYENSRLSPPTPSSVDLNALKSAALLSLNTECQKRADQITAGYPEFEKLTWENQRREALAWQADASVPTPYIDGLAVIRQIDREEYLRRTANKVVAFESAAQRLVGLRQRYEDQIKAVKVEAGEPDEEAAKARLAAIKFDFKVE